LPTRHQVRVRHQHRLAGQSRRGGHRRDARRRSQGGHHRPTWDGATTFLRSSDQAANTTPIHVKGPDGAWALSEVNLVEEPECWTGGHGLYSTPRDYIKVERALLGGGELDGVRILTQSTIEAAFTNQIGDLDFPAEIPTADPASTYTFAAGPGYKWGYGLLLNTTDIPGMRRA
jgi:methyl acetate hydrolase